jgi:segregation and condensation protein B
MTIQFVDGTRLASVIEALIFASTDPLAPSSITSLLASHEEPVDLDPAQVDRIVQELNARYEANDMAFRIEKVAGGYQFMTLSRFHPWLGRMQAERQGSRLSQSALETMAIIAYRQPVTKPEVDQVRGVDSGYVVRQLLEKGLIKVSGRAKSPGKPLLYKTTDAFLTHFGIGHVNELPRPREIEDILKDDDMAEHRKVFLESGYPANIQLSLQDIPGSPDPASQKGAIRTDSGASSGAPQTGGGPEKEDSIA